ncbi:hypothetical protein BKA82DRAFT_647013 [Pisolithus tinctorius]|nr:hypothetical protein BKA82DRAFT_647013 [Pisolithus tinctorius]
MKQARERTETFGGRLWKVNNRRNKTTELKSPRRPCQKLHTMATPGFWWWHLLSALLARMYSQSLNILNTYIQIASSKLGGWLKGEGEAKADVSCNQRTEASVVKYSTSVQRAGERDRETNRTHAQPKKKEVMDDIKRR